MRKKKAKIKKQNNDPIFLYEDELLYSHFKLFLLPDSPTSTAQTIFDTNGITIEIGIDGDFSDVVDSVLHEIQENILLLNNNRFVNTKDPTSFECFKCVFMLDHNDFQLMCYHASKKLTKMFPILYKIWKERIDDIKNESKNVRTNIKRQNKR